MPTTKATLADSIYNHSDLPKKEFVDIIDSLLEIIKRILESGEDVLISDFGKFCVKDKKERKGRNPQTADDMMLRARRVVLFQCSGTSRAKINGKMQVRPFKYIS